MLPLSDKTKGRIVKHKLVILLVCGIGLFLACACGSAARSIEVTRIVPQTVIATQLVTQIVPVIITTTPLPTATYAPSPTPTSTPAPKWTPDFSLDNINVITPTPGILVFDEHTRPNVEQFIPAEYLKEYLVWMYGQWSHGGKDFCGYTPMGIGNDGHTIQLYVWANCAEYYLQNQEMKMGFASSYPVVLFVEVRYGSYKIIDTGGGKDFLMGSSPPEIQRLYLHPPKAFDDEVPAIMQELKKEAEAFFGK